MAETLLFNIPTPASYQDTPVTVKWYQSIDGFAWGPVIDVIAIVDLDRDLATGKYRWYSTLADASKYHLLKTVSVNGVESSSGFILPPRPITAIDSTPSTLFTEKIATGNNTYSIGETIEIALQVDEYVADIIGDNINVFLLDDYDNVIDEKLATKIGTEVYCLQWTVPKNLVRLYNQGKEDTSSEYILHDRWILPSNTYSEYTFYVTKKPIEKPITDNSMISISITNLTAEDETSLVDGEVKFLTHLYPFYCSVEDVRIQNKEMLESFNNFEVANTIIEHSNHVDMALRPDMIVRQAAYDFAVSQWVQSEVAIALISSGGFNDSEETKELDTFKVTRKRNERRAVAEYLKETAHGYENIILAGGLDTPFKSRNFIKGLFDPNRPNLTRTGIDTSDNLPYLNYSVSSTVIKTQDGDNYELRGFRTVNYSNSFSASYANDLIEVSLNA